jgi:hypothetical protein
LIFAKGPDSLIIQLFATRLFDAEVVCLLPPRVAERGYRIAAVTARQAENILLDIYTRELAAGATHSSL